MGKKYRIHEEEVPRRGFLATLGLTGISLSGIIAGIGSLLYLKPSVDYGPPKIIRVGRPEDYKEGNKVAFEKDRFVVIRESSGFAALSLTCTHLGCTIRSSDIGFECPCHGSQYDSFGEVTGGPAPFPLEWYGISLAPNGELEVNKSIIVSSGTFLKI
jgi:cytochrome b6-f complex iron-sulfur subunit